MCGDALAAMADIRDFASASASGEITRRSPDTMKCSATMLLLPYAVPRVRVLSSVRAVPPSATPGLKVRNGSPPSWVRNSFSMRAASKIAPGPMSSRNTCDECAGVPFTVSVQPVKPRRAATAVRGSPSPSSNPSAICERAPASTSTRRAASIGAPGASSSPLSTTVMLMRSSCPAAFSALSAYSMITSPPFMSVEPGPLAVLSDSRDQRCSGLSGSNTVSR